MSELDSGILGAIIGGIIGSIATFVFGLLSQKNEKNDLKKNIKNLVHAELLRHRNFLDKILQKGDVKQHARDNIQIDANSEMGKEISRMMPHDSFSVQTYKNLMSETKANVFPPILLSKIDDVYAHLEDIRSSHDLGFFVFTISQIEKTITIIDDTMKILK